MTKKYIHTIGIVCFTLAAGACASVDGPTQQELGQAQQGEEEAAAALPCSGAIKPPPASLGLDPFYKKYLNAKGIPVVSSDQPADDALRIACNITVKMLEKRNDVRLQMIDHGGLVAVMGQHEVTTDIPEHRDLYEAFPGVDWNQYRGLGGTEARPATSCAEENLLCFANDPYKGENILIHEFAHGIEHLGIRPLNDGFVAQRDADYNAAVAAGKWKNTYADDNSEEYWAEGVQDWFDANLEAIPANGIHNKINTRPELKSYDRPLYDLIKGYLTVDAIAPLCP
jgi:hypothetical protein